MTSLNCPIASSDGVALSRKCSNDVDEEKREGELLGTELNALLGEEKRQGITWNGKNPIQPH